MTSGDAMDITDLRASAASAEVFVKGIRYPASKKKLIERAKKKDAPPGVLEVFYRLPDREYKSSLDLLREIDSLVLISAYKRSLGPETPGTA